MHVTSRKTHCNQRFAQLLPFWNHSKKTIPFIIRHLRIILFASTKTKTLNQKVSLSSTKSSSKLLDRSTISCSRKKQSSNDWSQTFYIPTVLLQRWYSTYEKTLLRTTILVEFYFRLLYYTPCPVRAKEQKPYVTKKTKQTGMMPSNAILFYDYSWTYQRRGRHTKNITMEKQTNESQVSSIVANPNIKDPLAAKSKETDLTTVNSLNNIVDAGSKCVTPTKSKTKTLTNPYCHGIQKTETHNADVTSKVLATPTQVNFDEVCLSDDSLIQVVDLAMVHTPNSNSPDTSMIMEQ